jgi:hypothetical protein
MAGLNDRAREHGEASRRRLKSIGEGGGDGGYQTYTVTYWNPAGVVVFRFYEATGGIESVFGPTETLPNVPAKMVLFTGKDDGDDVDFTITDRWTESPWEGWKSVSTTTIAPA